MEKKVNSLNDEELDMVAGGVADNKTTPSKNAPVKCSVCGSDMEKQSSILQGTYYVCKSCGNTASAGY